MLFVHFILVSLIYVSSNSLFDILSINLILVIHPK